MTSEKIRNVTLPNRNTFLKDSEKKNEKKENRACTLKMDSFKFKAKDNSTDHSPNTNSISMQCLSLFFHNLLQWVSIQWAYVFLFEVDFSLFFLLLFIMCLYWRYTCVYPSMRLRIKRESSVKNSNIMKHYRPFSGTTKNFQQ